MTENLQQSPLVRDIAKTAVVSSASVAATPASASNSYAAAIIAKIEALGAKVEALAAKDESYIKKYWPIAAGIAIALTRFL
jgi:hypothetical protein